MPLAHLTSADHESQSNCFPSGSFIVGGSRLVWWQRDSANLKPAAPGAAILRVGYIPITDCAQMYVAIEKGYFAEGSLDVRLEKLAGGPKVLEALAGKSLDIGFSNVVSVFLAKEQGLDFSLIYGGSVEDSLHAFSSILVSGGSNITTLADLRGKTIAVNTRRNIVELALGERLRSNGLTLSDVNLVEMPFPNMESVLESGDVAAIAVVEPFVSFALSHDNSRRISTLFTAPGDPPRPNCRLLLFFVGYPRMRMKHCVFRRPWIKRRTSLHRIEKRRFASLPNIPA
ncbi:MAG: ABC transporter substrate-binding protein [Flavobacteriales bacterium]|nr:ABC transporter substrate-binding protein [Flavobacteriales bacterium]